MRSIIGQCPDCCACEDALVYIRSRTGTDTSGGGIVWSSWSSWGLNSWVNFYSEKRFNPCVDSHIDHYTEYEFRVAHKISKLSESTGTYRAKWIERFVDQITYISCGVATGGGASITSIEVIDGGLGYATARATAFVETGAVNYIEYQHYGNGYTSIPTVTVGAPPSGGTQAVLTAVLDEYGGIYELTIDDAGAGYIDAPTITIAPPTRIGAATPVISMYASSGGGVQATATATLNADGLITSVALTNAGTQYIADPQPYVISSTHGLGRGAKLLAHYGTETAQEYVWDGIIPGGYDPAVNTTWPTSPVYSLTVPSSFGRNTFYVAEDPPSGIFRYYFCDGP